MSETLHVGLIQMKISRDTDKNIDLFRERATALCNDPRRPHLIVGVEFGIAPECIEDPNGPAMQRLGRLAAELGVWLVPGSLKMAEANGKFSNGAPVFDPSGTLAGIYRKMVPWDTDLEKGTIPGQDYHVFDITDPDVRFGLQICFDADFPEISRTLTLMGAEILIQLSMDPDSIPPSYQHIKYARAIENQAYYIYMNGACDYGHHHLGGGSLVISPEGDCIFEAGENPTSTIVSLDLDRLRHCRRHGSWDQVAQLQALREYAPGQPRAGLEPKSEVFQRSPFSEQEHEKT
ncbi:MAG TPA: carbon-nitrogen hydrolase family protein [Desulfomicrobiaceae bacterium]|nr:carbon-nitrogen hydrolase family protein [Desulfomicrobiaceae bacterium]